MGGIMGKKKCRVCMNEKGGLCIIKKIGVAVNKPRMCEAYIYDEGKLKIKQEIPITRIGYKDNQEYKRRLKEELKLLKKSTEISPSQDTTKSTTMENPISYIPRTDSKHPLTGDLSRFLTTANAENNV
jgi:hypothetical protein